jgi:hypothetical protein
VLPIGKENKSLWARLKWNSQIIGRGFFMKKKVYLGTAMLACGISALACGKKKS